MLWHLRNHLFLGCSEHMRCRLLLLMCVVSVHPSICHMIILGFTVWGSFDAVFAESLWPLVFSKDNLAVKLYLQFYVNLWLFFCHFMGMSVVVLFVILK